MTGGSKEGSDEEGRDSCAGEEQADVRDDSTRGEGCGSRKKRGTMSCEGVQNAWHTGHSEFLDNH